MAIKTAQKARDDDEKQKLRRRKGIVVMMLQFLQDGGFTRSVDAVQSDTGVSLSRFAAADNMDLVTVFSQFEEFYDLKFGRRPRFFRQLDDADVANDASFDLATGEGMLRKPVARPPVSPATPPSVAGPSSQANPRGCVTAPNRAQPIANRTQITKTLPGALPPIHGSSPPDSGFIDGSAVSVAGRGLKLSTAASQAAAPGMVDATHRGAADGSEAPERQSRLTMKPLPHFDSAEMNELAAMIHRDIVDQTAEVHWSDVAELDAAKQLLKEAIIMPSKYPQLFEGIGLRPWRGILLFGQPGTGKTMLAKAVATECRSTFFNVSGATLVSKWRGDSEKLVRMLFELAHYYAPSTIFIDELDSIMTSRGGSQGGGDHEATRRMKTEFLIQMDGLSKTRATTGQVFVLGASNLPWDLDSAVLRRLEKRIYIGLPGPAARLHMLRKGLSRVRTNVDWQAAVVATEGYSGADIDILCREAAMRTLRQLMERLEREQGLSQEAIAVPLVDQCDLDASIKATAPSAQLVPKEKYAEWARRYGSTLSEAAAC